MRARYPDQHGFVERNGGKLYYEVFGEGETTIFFLLTWPIIHSRPLKMQIPFFARQFRVLTFDGAFSYYTLCRNFYGECWGRNNSVGGGTDCRDALTARKHN